jgi:putative methyltransferase (TIGR04325 family)
MGAPQGRAHGACRDRADLHVPLINPVIALRERLRSIARAVGETRQHVADAREALSTQIGRLEGRIDAQQVESARQRDILRSISDREPQQRERLNELRASGRYADPFTQSDPLVSVVIPTYDNHEQLRERAIPSVLAQTYQHFEVIVVGDAASDDARAAVDSFADPRLRYSNLTYRGPYPADPQSRWYVAGVPPFNEAVRLARGSWIAPLDDDDAFRPDHIERLLETAQRERLELVYGTVLARHPNGTGRVQGAFPPESGEFALQTAIYHAGVAEIFELELTDALFDLPYDWGLCQRMLRAGVRMRMVDEISVDYFPSQWWTPRDGSGPPQPAPEWEFVPDGWELARDTDEPCARGWDVDAVAHAYARHWPAFRAAIAGAQPLGVVHELTSGATMTNTSPVAHNASMTLAYVLARMAPEAGPMTVLDVGGGLGHQHEIGRSVLPAVDFDWHIRELPAVCREGRLVSPSITFHDSDECLERSYDLVLASGSFQYFEDWRVGLRRLSRAASDNLFITRLPLVEVQPSFVVIQRAEAYGYATEYLGWVFNRTELLAEATAAGLALVREFVLDGPMEIAGAPERPYHGGMLFRRSQA